MAAAVPPADASLIRLRTKTSTDSLDTNFTPPSKTKVNKSPPSSFLDWTKLLEGIRSLWWKVLDGPTITVTSTYPSFTKAWEKLLHCQRPLALPMFYEHGSNNSMSPNAFIWAIPRMGWDRRSRHAGIFTDSQIPRSKLTPGFFPALCGRKAEDLIQYDEDGKLICVTWSAAIRADQP